jgi:DNA (cytosine-5)-methyltransferase 1
MADSRSGLWAEVVRILDVQRPRWFLGENVPGILSVNGGEDWATVLADLGRLGYGFAYRILDAQWFGVPQRRRRVFVVGCLGDWRSAAEILFERESLPWDSPPSRESGSRVAYGVAAGAGGSKFGSGRDGQDTFVTHTLTGEGFDASEDGTGRGTPIIPFDTGQVTSKQNRSRCEPGDPCHTLPAQGHVPSIAYAIQERAVSENPNTGPQGKGYAAETAYTLEARHHQQSIANRFGVRRLMPIECERLQGFPDDWTRFGADGEEITDSARYRMCGNAVAFPCIEWIGRRLMEAAGD